MKHRACELVFALSALCVAGACSKTNPASPSPSAAPTVDAQLTASVATPRPLTPAGGAVIANLAQPVTLAVQNAVVTKAGGTTYTFEVATDAAFASKGTDQGRRRGGERRADLGEARHARRREGLLLARARDRRRDDRRVRRGAQVDYRSGDRDQRTGSDQPVERNGDRIAANASRDQRDAHRPGRRDQLPLRGRRDLDVQLRFFRPAPSPKGSTRPASRRRPICPSTRRSSGG